MWSYLSFKDGLSLVVSSGSAVMVLNACAVVGRMVTVFSVSGCRSPLLRNPNVLEQESEFKFISFLFPEVYTSSYLWQARPLTAGLRLRSSKGTNYMTYLSYLLSFCLCLIMRLFGFNFAICASSLVRFVKVLGSRIVKSIKTVNFFNRRENSFC